MGRTGGPADDAYLIFSCLRFVQSLIREGGFFHEVSSIVFAQPSVVNPYTSLSPENFVWAGKSGTPTTKPLNT